ncbi:MAG: glycosyltransferase family 39 protein [Patescibacteria group bacterium]
MQLPNFFRANPWLIVLLFIGLSLRLWGIGIGLPGTALVGDETSSISYILRILATGNPFIHTVNPYPIMMSLLAAPFVVLNLAYIWISNGLHGTGELQTYLVVHGVSMLQIWPRLIAAFFGTATIFVVFRILSRLFSRPAAYVGTTAVTISLLAVHLSHWGRSHAVMTFFIAASAYAAIRCAEDRSKKYYYATYILAACSLATHYLGATALIFPFLMIWFYKPNQKEFWKAFGLASLIVIPAYLLNFSGTVLMVWGAFHNYYIPNDFASLLPVGRYERFYYIFRDLFYLDPVGVVAGGLGVAWVLYKRQFSKPMLVMLMGLAYFYLIQITIVAAPRESRWLLPMDIMFITFGFAAVTQAIYEMRWKGRSVLLIITFMLLIPQSVVTLKWLSLHGDHTQLKVERWMSEHKAERIYVNSKYINPTPTAEAAAWNAENSLRLKSSAKNSYVIEHPSLFAANGLTYFVGDELSDENRCSTFAALKINYIVADYTSRQEKADALDKIKDCISPEPVFVASPGKESLLDLPYENLVNTILTDRFVFGSESVGPWYEVYSVSTK